MFCHGVFFIMHLPLDMRVYNWMFIDSLGCMTVDRIKKSLLRLTHTIYTLWESDQIINTKLRNTYFIFPLMTAGGTCKCDF